MKSKQCIAFMLAITTLITSLFQTTVAKAQEKNETQTLNVAIQSI